MPEHVSLDAMDDTGPGFYTVFGDRRWRWPIVDYVGPSMDWSQFEDRCSSRDRQIVQMKREVAANGDRIKSGHLTAAVNQRLRVLLSRWHEMTAA